MSAGQGLRAKLRQLAQHPAGVHSSNPDLAEWSSTQIGVQGRKMVKLGQLFAAKISYRNARYFATAEARDAFVQAYLDRKQTRRAAPVKADDIVAPWSARAAIAYHKDFRFTACPSPAPRFREHTFSFIHSGLRCA
jgi:hypothetical protein